MANSISRSNIDFSLIKRVLRFTKPYSKIVGFTFALTLLLALLSPIRPYLVQLTIDNYVLTGDLDGIIRLCLWMFGLLIAETLLQYSQTYYAGWIGQTVIRDLRVKIFAHLSRFKLAYFDKTPLGTVVTRVVNDVETISDMFGDGLLSIAGDLLKLLMVLIAMFYISPEMTLVSLVPVPLLILSTYIFKNGIRKSFTEVRNEVANLNAFTQEHITGMQVIQAFNREKDEEAKFREINRRHRKAHIKSVWYYSVFFPVVEVLQAFSIALLVWWGTWQILTHPESDVKPGAIIAFILYIYMLYRPMRQLADRFNTLQMGVVSAERLFKLLDTNEKTEDSGLLDDGAISGNLAFKNVSFGYVPGEHVIQNLNLEINAGEKIAVVGATGSGKSTLISLICRLYEVNSGQILLEGKDIKSYKLEALHNAIALVPQDVFLFRDSIFNNISLYNKEISNEAIESAAKAVGAHDFIKKLPEGYNFNVRERGGMLSSGQRQLLAFIRAYVYNPRILILDEATSSIDSESEQLIQNATEAITQNRTAIIIAHRLSTIRNADKIIVMEKGKIIESGNHDSLLIQNGHYKKLFDMQFANV
jgi:ATP-binding cassette, subfamily B, multidrug efflux pump